MILFVCKVCSAALLLGNVQFGESSEGEPSMVINGEGERNFREKRVKFRSRTASGELVGYR